MTTAADLSMTVAELIAELDHLDPRARVFVTHPSGEAAVIDGDPVTGLRMAGGDVYLTRGQS